MKLNWYIKTFQSLLLLVSYFYMKLKSYLKTRRREFQSLLLLVSYFYRLVILEDTKEIRSLWFQSLLLLVSYFYAFKIINTVATFSEGFNPYYYWLVIFTRDVARVTDTDSGSSFNPYYYWLVIFTSF